MRAAGKLPEGHIAAAQWEVHGALHSACKHCGRPPNACRIAGCLPAACRRGRTAGAETQYKHSAIAVLRCAPSGLGRAGLSDAQVEASIQETGLISFIDGRSYQTLKRHLTAHGLTPERYRAKYGLPADYPMVAPGYAARRSEIARAIQLGHKAA